MVIISFSTIISILILLFLLFYLRVNASKKHLFIHLADNSSKSIHNKSLPVNIYLSLCDYFHPFSGSVSQEIAEHRVVTWCKEYLKLSKLHVDSSGNHPIHSFFYSEADYNPRLLDVLYRLHKEKLSDVEILIPYIEEPLDNFKHKIEEFRDALFYHHGFLRKSAEGSIRYGFATEMKNIYGNKNIIRNNALLKKLSILLETGCYADFSLFSKKIHREYLKIINLSFKASFVSGLSETFSDNSIYKDLQLVLGPTANGWLNRKWGIFPYLETGEISSIRNFESFRINSWLQNCIRIDSDIINLFIKLHTFGGLDQNIRYLLGESGLHQMFTCFEKLCANNNFVLNYVSAYEMYEKINTISLEKSSNIKKNC